MLEVGIELLDCLRTLVATARGLELEIREPAREPNQHLARLKAVVSALGQAKPAKSVRCPEEYVKQWHEFLKHGEPPPEHRAVRYLCWQPEIATGQTFQYYLDHDRITLNARSLQGLVRSCHTRWSQEFGESQIVTRVRNRLETYKGANRLLSEWKANSTVIMGPKGAEEFGAEMVRKVRALKQHCEFWGITNETCAYVQGAVHHAAKMCRDQIDRVPEMRQYLLAQLLPWHGWAPDLLKQEVSQVILHPATAHRSDVNESVRKFVLNDARLGDPRLPLNRINWAGISEAERKFVEWLSQLDIVFFFESVLTHEKDPHGRKAFWLRYVARVVKSRPLLDWDDKYRLAAILKQKGRELAHFGLIDGQTSAFLLDFGPILAVEFSDVGNACYLYRKDDGAVILPDFFASKPFDGTKLKRRNVCLERVVHRKGWEEEAAQVLARFGVRPGDRR